MLALLLGLVLSGVDLMRGISKIERLARLPSLDGPAPLVSLIVAARNEERNVEAAARSLLAQAYPALEIIAVDDRSVDRTGAILDKLPHLFGYDNVRQTHRRTRHPREIHCMSQARVLHLLRASLPVGTSRFSCFCSNNTGISLRL